MTKSGFSVLLSIYYKEHKDWFYACIESIFNQTVVPNEVVLVKDGPLTDDLDEAINFCCSNHPEIKIVALEKNGGLGNALNIGIRHCSNELVARMDTDDICKPDRFEKQLKVFEQHPEYDAISCWIDEFIDSKDNVVSIKKLPETPKEIFDYGKKRSPLNHPAVMYKKSKVIEAGGYQSFPEDLYLWVNMLMNGCKFYNIQESLLWFRSSKDVYKRRGGWKYAKLDLKAQWHLYKIGYIGVALLIYNCLVRTTVRLLPNSLRAWFYSTFLRK